MLTTERTKTIIADIKKAKNEGNHKLFGHQFRFHPASSYRKHHSKDQHRID